MGGNVQLQETADATDVQLQFSAGAPYTFTARCRRHHGGHATVRLTSEDWATWPDAATGEIVPDLYDDAIKVNVVPTAFYLYESQQVTGKQTGCAARDTRFTDACVILEGAADGLSYQIEVDDPPGYKTTSVQFPIVGRKGQYSPPAPLPVDGKLVKTLFDLTPPEAFAVRVFGRIDGKKEVQAEENISIYGAVASSYHTQNIHYTVVEKLRERTFR